MDYLNRLETIERELKDAYEDEDERHILDTLDLLDRIKQGELLEVAK